MSGDTPSPDPLEEVFAEADERFDAIMAHPEDREAWGREVKRARAAAAGYDLAIIYLERGWTERARQEMTLAVEFGAVDAAHALFAIKDEEPVDQDAPNAAGPWCDDYARFFRSHYQKVVRFLRRAGATVEEAHTMTQNSMTEAWRQWHRLADPASWVRGDAILSFVNSRKDAGGRIDGAAGEAVVHQAPDPDHNALDEADKPDEEYVSHDAMVWRPAESWDERASPVPDTTIDISNRWLIIGDKKFAVRGVERIWVSPIKRRARRSRVLGVLAAVLVTSLASAGVISWGELVMSMSAIAVVTAAAEIWRRIRVHHSLNLTYEGRDVPVFQTSDADKLRLLLRRFYAVRERKKRNRITANV